MIGSLDRNHAIEIQSDPIEDGIQFIHSITFMSREGKIVACRAYLKVRFRRRHSIEMDQRSSALDATFSKLASNERVFASSSSSSASISYFLSPFHS